jgi:hypothetical protein
MRSVDDGEDVKLSNTDSVTVAVDSEDTGLSSSTSVFSVADGDPLR